MFISLNWSLTTPPDAAVGDQLKSGGDEEKTDKWKLTGLGGLCGRGRQQRHTLTFQAEKHTDVSGRGLVKLTKSQIAALGRRVGGLCTIHDLLNKIYPNKVLQGGDD